MFKNERGEAGTSFLDSTQALIFEMTKRALAGVRTTKASTSNLFTKVEFQVVGGIETYNAGLGSEFVFPEKRESYIQLSENWREPFYDYPNIQYSAGQLKAKYINVILPAELNA
jgi:hypothetical protein